MGKKKKQTQTTQNSHKQQQKSWRCEWNPAKSKFIQYSSAQNKVTQCVFQEETHMWNTWYYQASKSYACVRQDTERWKVECGVSEEALLRHSWKHTSKKAVCVFLNRSSRGIRHIFIKHRHNILGKESIHSIFEQYLTINFLSGFFVCVDEGSKTEYICKCSQVSTLILTVLYARNTCKFIISFVILKMQTNG